MSVVKTLILVRHAKSSWNSAAESDFDRPLNERGKKDAPIVAQRVKDKISAIDAFVSSPAKRAKKTAQAFCEVFNSGEADLHFITKLYGAGVEDFQAVVAGLDDQWHTVAIFSHNPGITDFVNSLLESIRLDEMPTCGVFAVQCKVAKWQNFAQTEKDFLFFDYPKMQ
ncbi:MAG: hypothetical protein RLY16_1297 [Bacteroidota bacterium]|jgi:phosphohistidine phosphatase